MIFLKLFFKLVRNQVIMFVSRQKINMNLLAGSYTIGAEVRNNRFSEYLDMVVNAINFQVVENYSHGGVSDLKPKCTIHSQ